ncbi:hypothetical protein E2C01_063057 [Portunus trituberculatus]|uniref:Uncharacterized protein n=1 Tax=Portunus trituberculatus TaxID=210409 RepID=A0A5B7HHR2_PORTR|nr:hypothetical protein [Portunus trituberculatus]
MNRYTWLDECGHLFQAGQGEKDTSSFPSIDSLTRRLLRGLGDIVTSSNQPVLSTFFVFFLLSNVRPCFSLTRQGAAKGTGRVEDLGIGRKKCDEVNTVRVWERSPIQVKETMKQVKGGSGYHLRNRLASFVHEKRTQT